MSKLNRRNFCQCPCHGIAKSGNKFIHGHNMKGGHHTEETLKKLRGPRGPMSEEGKLNIKIARNKPEVKAKQAQSLRITNAKPKVKERRSKSQTIAQNKPEVKEKIALTNAKPEVKERRSKAAKKNWADPKFKEKRTIAQTIAQNKPEVKAKIAITNAKPEVKAKRSRSAKIAGKKPEVKKRRSIANKEAQNKPETKAKTSQSVKNLWQKASYVSDQMKARHVKQNKTEKKLENTIDKTIPNEYKFVGHGEVIIAGKCPDFININGQKKIIELYGDYWHKGQDPQDRINIFAKYGYDTLVIWEHELKDAESLKIKIGEFHMKINPYSIHKESLNAI